MSVREVNDRDPLVVDLLSAPLTEELVRGLLREVIDPELGVNIVDLGLIYGVDIEAAHVMLEMTLTTPACPLGGYMEDNIRRVLTTLPQVSRVSVDVVFEPLWEPSCMSDAAKEQLGWF